jgi:hypothetical protein
MQAFQTQFTLSRDYLAECFDQSLPHGKNVNTKYLFAGVLLILGLGLLYLSEQPKIIGAIFIALGVLELIHIRFKRAWWITRQMWSKSANRVVKLSIDEKSVETQNPYTKTTLLWADVERVIETELGLILVVKTGGQQYLSKSLFSDELIAQIKAKVE